MFQESNPLHACNTQEIYTHMPGSRPSAKCFYLSWGLYGEDISFCSIKRIINHPMGSILTKVCGVCGETLERVSKLKRIVNEEGI